MPTKNPRITITLDTTTYETLARLSAVGGDSMSRIVTGFLSVCVPSMERMVLVMERAKMAPKEARAGLEAAIASIEAQVLPAMVERLEQQDLFLDQVVREATAAAIAAAAGTSSALRGTEPVPAPLDPRPVTRGSGRVKTPPRVPANGGKHGPL